MEKMKEDEVINIDFRDRLFGDVLRDMVYLSGHNTYSFSGKIGINNVLLSNLINHKKYPGVITLRKISQFLPTDERNGFIAYYKNPNIKKESIEKLKNQGMMQPYDCSSEYDKVFWNINMYSEDNRAKLDSLQMQGLLKYLTREEKNYFKNRIITYILERNQAINSSCGKVSPNRESKEDQRIKNKNVLGNTLKRLRLERDYTLTEVARGSNVSAASLSKYENGLYTPGDLNLKRLAKFYDITVEELENIENGNKGS